ncbi:alpha/beta hydrolase [Actibacterium pelagium]|uniref:Hydrolase n=1 Tax=Actibacterium pelagium TaxID=2029103 RepID=A0A917AFL2_9RHOB|nr:alpha/beta hydrolase [Actibacterium pelagium]GGE46943.1 hydrolase [Actibacterium pelagium]
MDSAPLYNELAEGPNGGAGYWLTAPDGVRLRIGVWPEGTEGTIFLFPGRTEYVEKYGRAAQDFNARGFAVLSVDWRGQGLADRLLDDPMVGHVDHLTDYQKDVEVVLRAADNLALPKPYYLLGHSMGGCIGLRALHEGLPVAAASFSGPMWDIQFGPFARPFAQVFSSMATNFGKGHMYAPTTSGDVTYVLNDPFEDNNLTHDLQMWEYMTAQATARPELTLGGPSLRWLSTALLECSVLAAKPAPKVPAITFVGEAETIVSKQAIAIQMRKWRNGDLYLLPKCRHEVMMETSDLRTEFYDRTAQFFKDHAKGRNAA